jgi:hypothetical protein
VGTTVSALGSSWIARGVPDLPRILRDNKLNLMVTAHPMCTVTRSFAKDARIRPDIAHSYKLTATTN